MVKKIAGFLVYRPWVSLLIGILLCAGLSAGMAKLKSDFSYRIWFKNDNPYLVEFDKFERLFGNDENIAIIVHSENGIFDEESIKFIQLLTRELWKVPEVIRVDSLTNYNWTDVYEDEIVVEPLFAEDASITPEDIASKYNKVMKDELLPGYLISKDGKTSIIYGPLQPAINKSPDFKKVTLSARELVEKYKDHGNHQLYVTGTSAVNYGFEELGQQDMGKVMPVVLGMMLLFLLMSFRRFSATLLPFVVITAVILMTLGASGFIGLQFNNLTSAVTPILIAITIACTVHLLFTFFSARQAGYDRKQAAVISVEKNFFPILLTELTTMIGFLSNGASDVVPLTHMGYMAAIGTLLAWVMTMLLLVPLLSLMPIKVKQKVDKVGLDQPATWAVNYVNWVGRNAISIIIVTSLLTIGAVYLSSKNEINSDPLKYFAEDVPVRVADEFAEKHLGGQQAIEIMIDSGAAEGIKDPEFLRKTNEFQQWLDEQPYINKTISLLDILKDTNRALNGGRQEAYALPTTSEWAAQEIFVYTMSMPQGMDLNNRMTVDNRSLRLTALSSLHDSNTTLAEIERIENKAKEIGIDAQVTGKMLLGHSINPLIVNSFLSSIAIAFTLIAIFLCVVFRSVKLGLLSMVPNVIPLFFGAATMSILNKPLDVGTVLVASTCLGIAVDDTIHFMTDYYRKIRLGYEANIALAQVFTHTGPGMLIITLVLVTGFGSFVLGSFTPNINFGILTAVILSVAMAIEVLLVPAALLIRKKANDKALAGNFAVQQPS